MDPPLTVPLALTLERAARQRALAARAVASADVLWGRVDPRRIRASWQIVAGQMLAMLAAAQQASAEGSQQYVAAAVTALGGTSDPNGLLDAAAFAGWAADGRSLESLLDLPTITTLTNLSAGVPQDQAMQAGRSQLLQMVSSEVVDAGRSAAGVSITSNRTCTGYVRVVTGGACSRCVILAGQVYRTAIPFRRHPHCHCVHEPTIRGRRSGPSVDPHEYFRNLSAAEQNRRFGRAGAQAIRDGADIFSVVNARRKGAMYTTQAYGGRVRATLEGTTRRGDFYRRERAAAAARTGTRFARDRIEMQQGLPRFQLRTPRLMPEEIYRLAANRDEAIAMLRRYAYLR